MKPVAACLALAFATGTAGAQSAQDCAAQGIREAQAEKARAQEQTRKIEGFRATLGDSPQHRAAVQTADRALARNRDAIAKIDERLRLYQAIPDLTRQIEETKRQLRQLGFEERSADFDRLGEMSRNELELTKARLLDQFKKVTLGKGADHLQEKFLERIRTMSPQKLTAIAEKLKKAGADDPVFQGWLRSFRPNASREVLVNGAKEAIKYLENAESLEGVAGGLNQGTVEGRQDAFLEVLSLVSDYPALGELSAVATGTYQVGEAAVFLTVLSGNERQLDRVTREQLSRQKLLIKRMETLVKQRKAACQGAVPSPAARPSA